MTCADDLRSTCATPLLRHPARGHPPSTRALLRGLGACGAHGQAPCNAGSIVWRRARQHAHLDQDARRADRVAVWSDLVDPKAPGSTTSRTTNGTSIPASASRGVAQDASRHITRPAKLTEKHHGAPRREPPSYFPTATCVITSPSSIRFASPIPSGRQPHVVSFFGAIPSSLQLNCAATFAPRGRLSKARSFVREVPIEPQPRFQVGAAFFAVVHWRARPAGPLVST